MGFIESPAEHQAAIRNGWLDEHGRVTVDGAKAFKLLSTRSDPNRPVAEMLREAARRPKQAD